MIFYYSDKKLKNKMSDLEILSDSDLESSDEKTLSNNILLKKIDNICNNKDLNDNEYLESIKKLLDNSEIKSKINIESVRVSYKFYSIQKSLSHLFDNELMCKNYYELILSILLLYKKYNIICELFNLFTENNNINIKNYAEYIFLAASKCKSIQIIKKMMDVKNDYRDLMCSYTFTDICIDGHLYLIKLLFEYYKKNNIIIKYVKSKSKSKSKKKSLSDMETDSDSEDSNTEDSDTDYESDNETFNSLGQRIKVIYINFNKLFYISCSFGHIELVKFLLEYTNNNIDLNYKNDKIYHYVCKNGHLEILKLLLSLPDNKINIYSKGYEINKVTQNSEIIKFLLSIPNNKFKFNKHEFYVYNHEKKEFETKYYIQINKNKRFMVN